MQSVFQQIMLKSGFGHSRVGRVELSAENTIQCGNLCMCILRNAFPYGHASELVATGWFTPIDARGTEVIGTVCMNLVLQLECKVAQPITT